jgi:hypothetical protein
LPPRSKPVGNFRIGFWFECLVVGAAVQGREFELLAWVERRLEDGKKSLTGPDHFGILSGLRNPQ